MCKLLLLTIISSVLNILNAYPVFYQPVDTLPLSYPVRNVGPYTDSRYFWNSFGDFIQSTPFLPIEINVPNTISTIYNGVSSITSNVLQRIPIINRWANPSQPRPYGYFILAPIPIEQSFGGYGLYDISNFPQDIEYNANHIVTMNNNIKNNRHELTKHNNPSEIQSLGAENKNVNNTKNNNKNSVTISKIVSGSQNKNYDDFKDDIRHSLLRNNLNNIVYTSPFHSEIPNPNNYLIIPELHEIPTIQRDAADYYRNQYINMLIKDRLKHYYLLPKDLNSFEHNTPTQKNHEPNLAYDSNGKIDKT